MKGQHCIIEEGFPPLTKIIGLGYNVRLVGNKTAREEIRCLKEPSSPFPPRSCALSSFGAQIQSRSAQIPSLHFFPTSDSLSYVRSRNEESAQLPNTSSCLVGVGSYQRLYPHHRALSQVAGIKRLVLSCDKCPKTDLVAVILSDLAKSHQMYSMANR
jgi:hypothetical protein